MALHRPRRRRALSFAGALAVNLALFALLAIGPKTEDAKPDFDAQSVDWVFIARPAPPPTQETPDEPEEQAEEEKTAAAPTAPRPRLKEERAAPAPKADDAAQSQGLEHGFGDLMRPGGSRSGRADN